MSKAKPSVPTHPLLAADAAAPRGNSQSRAALSVISLMIVATTEVSGPLGESVQPQQSRGRSREPLSKVYQLVGAQSVSQHLLP
ncbi:hypothetical protein [Micromonospora wenchangensis]|uniref:hypothetical protein n=1 Tax=Micromonospora wenchangensis TaxID=1185415 RepID=UPI00382AD06F